MLRGFAICAALAALMTPALSAQPTLMGLIARPVLATPAPMTPIPSKGVRIAQACCKTCSKGKACGDSCISREKQCHKGQGCACDQ